jgi:hypothetical protein
MKTRSKGLRTVEMKMLFRQILVDARFGQGVADCVAKSLDIGRLDTRVSIDERAPDLSQGWCWQRYSNDGERTTVVVLDANGAIQCHQGSWGSNGIGRDRSPVDFDAMPRPFRPGMVLVEMVEGSNNRGSFQRVTITKAPVLDD